MTAALLSRRRRYVSDRLTAIAARVRRIDVTRHVSQLKIRNPEDDALRAEVCALADGIERTAAEIRGARLRD